MQEHHEGPEGEVLQAHRRLLIVRAHGSGSAVAFVVGHGPDASKATEVKAWWQKLTAAVKEVHTEGAPVVCFLDANAGVGERAPNAIESRAADPEDSPGGMLHDVLLATNLALPATFKGRVGAGKDDEAT